MTDAPKCPVRTIYAGPFIHSKSLQELDICKDGSIWVDEEGKIVFVDGNADTLNNRPGWEQAKLVRVPEGAFFFPGFIGIFFRHA